MDFKTLFLSASFRWCKITNLIQSFFCFLRRQTGGKEPVIVVDGSSCLGHIYKGLDWVSGGQYKEYIEKLGKFVQAFKQIGVKLVFYFGGGTVNPKRKEWIKRCFERLERVYQMFDQLSDGLRTTDLHQSLFSLPPGVGTLSQHYLEHIFGCEVIISSSGICRLLMWVKDLGMRGEIGKIKKELAEEMNF